MKIKCYADKKFFPAEKEDELDFCICQFKTAEGEELPEEITNDVFTAKGAFLPYSKGAMVTLNGEWEKGRNGKSEFAVSDFTVEIPSERGYLCAYLSTIEGCDKDDATRLFNEFGEDVLSVLDNNPYEAATILKRKGQADQFVMSYMLHRFCLPVYRFLRKHRVECETAKSVAMASLTIGNIETRPFRYCIVSTLPYNVALKIAKKEGISPLSDEAIQAAMLDVLRGNEGKGSTFSEDTTGNTFMEKDSLFKKSANLLGIFPDDGRLRKAFADLFIGEYVCLFEGRYVYRKTTLEAESAIATEAARIMSGEIEAHDMVNDVYALEDQKKMRLAPEQRDAVEICLSHPFTLLIGGPGCGKTTIEQFIIELFKQYHPDKNVLLLAPTGKAASRMSESTGEKACTVHHGLGVNAGAEVLVADKMLDAGLILVDEASMLDTQVASALFKAVETGTQLILVGDTDQLPSVSAGNVLFELIRSGIVPIARLLTVYRQKAGSTIAVDCAKIRQGFKELEYDEGVFDFIEAADDDEAARIAIDEFQKGLDRGLKIDDICLLSPYRRTTATGVNALNAQLQKILNKNANEESSITYGQDQSAKVFYLGDKVMCMKNMGEEVANGDTGFIVAVEKGKKFTVDYGDGRKLTYRKADMKYFELAYGISIHKSQGQEFKLCIILACDSHSRMLKRNLMYTAVSRAKQQVIIIGQKSALYKCIDTEDVTVRQSRLGAMLRAKVTV